MPIRMTDDPGHDDGGNEPPRRGSRGGGGGGDGGGIGAFLSLLGLMIRYPKMSLVLIGGLVVYAVFFSDGSSGGGGPNGTGLDAPVSAPISRTEAGRGLGATLDPRVYDEALSHEPLADVRNKGLPERVSLIDHAPTRRSQGSQGSCVGWATSYAARTILHARETGRDPDEVVFSPAFVYNPIALAGCNGTYLKKALESLERNGDLPLGEFTYTDRSCDRTPTSAERDRARNYRIKGFTRLTMDADDYRTNAEAVKTHLAQGAPVVIGMFVGGTFETAMQGRKVWHPTQQDYADKEDWGGHAMAVIGYDDVLEGGAFQIMNSWGDDWGEGGVGFVRYKDFDFFVREAFGLYPMGVARRAEEQQRIHFALVNASSLDRLPLQQVEPLVYRTSSPIRKGDRFKVEFANTRPVYTYIFGQETDGTSYVLFPYTAKHSPYCGTTGTRIFPRNQSLTADDIGERDSIAVVVSPEPLDPQELNGRITAAQGASYGAKLTAALGNKLDADVKTRATKGAIEMNAPGDRLHALVIEFDKR